MSVKMSILDFPGNEFSQFSPPALLEEKQKYCTRFEKSLTQDASGRYTGMIIHKAMLDGSVQEYNYSFENGHLKDSSDTNLFWDIDGTFQTREIPLHRINNLEKIYKELLASDYSAQITNAFYDTQDYISNAFNSLYDWMSTGSDTPLTDEHIEMIHALMP